MDIKKDYILGDPVWIHGIHRDNRLVKGEVIKKFVMDHPNYSNDYYYIVEIPTHIEPLLEIRQWENMSQDQHGPIGMYRSLGTSKSVTDRFMKKVGYNFSSDTNPEDLEEPTAEQIHAAIEKSQKANKHTPLMIKPEKPKRKFYNRKKKT